MIKSRLVGAWRVLTGAAIAVDADIHEYRFRSLRMRIVGAAIEMQGSKVDDVRAYASRLMRIVNEVTR